MSHFNWTRGVVTTGGTGDIVLDAVNGYPTFNQVIGVGPYFPYSILNADLTPRENGIGRMLDANTMRRETVYETFIAGALDNTVPAPSNVPVGAIVNTPATWQSLDADFAIDFIDGNRGGHNKIKQIDIAQNHCDVSGRNVTFYPAGRVLDLGNVSGVVDLDMTWPVIKMNCTGDVTFTISNPPPAGFAADTRLEIRRVTSSGAQVTFPGNVAFQSVVPPLLSDLQTTVISFSTVDGGVSYIGFANAIVIEVTASGLATTFNPSDYYGTPLALTNGNRTIEWTGAKAAAYRTARCFGGKSAGKWRIAVRNDLASSAGTSSTVYFNYGIAPSSLLLSTGVGFSSSSYAKSFMRQNATGMAYYKVNNSVLTAHGASMPVANTICGALVDLDAGKIWFTTDGVVDGGGDPSLGTLPAFTFTPGAVYFPSFSLYEAGSSSEAGQWTLLNEVQDPYAATWPSFQNWTA